MPIAFRGISRRFIPDMLKLGWTTTRGLGYLREHGLGYRRKDFLADWREYEGRERKRDKLRSVRDKLHATWDTMEKAAGIQRARFNYNFKIEGYDTFLEKDTEDWITVTSEESLSMEQAEAEARAKAEKYKKEIEIRKMVRDSVTYR